MASMLVIPQFQLWFVKTSQAAPDVSFGTTAESNANPATPDLSVVCVRFKWENPIDLDPDSPHYNAQYVTSWRRAFKIEHAGVPILTEIKRPGTRSASTVDDFVSSLNTLMDEAKEQLEEQAFHLFSSILWGAQLSVVLFACVGEWWKFRIVTREEIMYPPKKSFLSGDSDTETLEVKAGAPNRDDPLLLDPPMRLYKDIGEDIMEQVVEDINDAIPPPGAFSDYLLLGSHASNQRLWLIHNHLQTITENPDDYTRG